jgi:SAM-dependent methyltransferase
MSAFAEAGIARYPSRFVAPGAERGQLAMPWLVAAVYDRFMRGAEVACLTAWRAELLAGLSGDVLDVGAGTGANLPHYPAPVQRIVLAEPDPHMLRRLRRKLEQTRDPRVETLAAPVEALPFPDASFDAVVSTLVLCSVVDQAVALREIRRLLRPDGVFVFLEHVAAEGKPRRLAWQRRCEPVWKWLMGGCHLTRLTRNAIAAAGLRIEREQRESMRKAFPIARPCVRGIARN